MPGHRRWFLRIRGELQNPADVFAIFNLLNKIPTTKFPVRHPTAAEIRKGKSDLVLIGEGIKIEMRNAATPLEISDSKVAYGVGNLMDRDWRITFDAFPGVEVELYRHRGRPREEVRRARIRGERISGKKWPEVAKKVDDISTDLARHYRDRAAPRLKDRGGARASTPPGEAKTSGN